MSVNLRVDCQFKLFGARFADVSFRNYLVLLARIVIYTDYIELRHNGVFFQSLIDNNYGYAFQVYHHQLVKPSVGQS